MILPESIERAVTAAGATGASHVQLSVADASALAEQIRLGNEARAKLVLQEGWGGIAAAGRGLGVSRGYDSAASGFRA